MEQEKDLVEETNAFEAGENGGVLDMQMIDELDGAEGLQNTAGENKTVDGENVGAGLTADEINAQTAEKLNEQTDAQDTGEGSGVFAGALGGLGQESVYVKNDIPPDTNMVGQRMDADARWYVLHTFSGYEAVAEDNLKKVVEKYNLQQRVFEIFIPTEDTVVERREKKVMVASKTMPSYIFIKMIYGDDLWHTITRTRGITGFVGPKGRPLPLTNKEVLDMKLERRVNLNVKLEKGDTIQVVDGPLAGQTAHVTSVDAVAGKCTASVSMFGRPTKVELYLNQVKKMG